MSNCNVTISLANGMYDTNLCGVVELKSNVQVETPTTDRVIVYDIIDIFGMAELGQVTVMVPGDTSQRVMVLSMLEGQITSVTGLLNRVIIMFNMTAMGGRRRSGALDIMYNTQRTESAVVLQVTFSSAIGLPLPSTPEEGHDFCAEPIITITNLQTSNSTGDILEVDYEVLDATNHKKLNSCYSGCVVPITNGTRFTLFAPFINCVVTETNEMVREFIVFYAALKLILARLVIGEFNIRWLYRCNYEELICRITRSRYRNFLTVLEQLRFLEVYFKCKPEC